MNTENKSEQKFEKPRHWVSMEELTPEYWNDTSIQERRSQEFYDKPIETLEKIESMDKSGVSRRDFLTIMGASMAMASFACARRPVNKIIPYVIQPQEMTPGVPLFYASTYKDGMNSYGIVVKTREGRPIKLEGNDLDPTTHGSLSAKGQASLLRLYDPERLKAPMKGTKEGGKSTTNWAEVDALVVAALKASKKIRILTLPENGESTRRMMKEFMSGIEGSTHADLKWIEVDPIGMYDVVDGQNESYGTSVVPNYAFDQADVVVSFGADFLGTWGNTIQNAAQWSKKRKLNKASDELSKLFVFESNMSITGASSDERFPIIPGTEVAAAFAVAHELIVVQKKGKFAGNADVQAMLAGKAEEWLSKAGALDVAKVKKVADALAEAKGKSLVVGSGSVALQAVVNLLNSNMESEGKTVDGASDVLPVTSSIRGLLTLQGEMDAGQVDLLIVNGVNPVYFMPTGSVFAAAMKKVKTVVAINDRVDETAQNADLVLSANHYLENWGDAHAKPSVYSVVQPAISPIHDTRSFEDMIIGWTRAGAPATGLLAQTATNSKGNFYDYVKENWKQTLFTQHGKGQSFLDFWETTLQKGVLTVNVGPARERAFKVGSLRAAKDAVAALKNMSLGTSKKGPATEGSGVALGLYSSIAMGDGSNANNAWLMEMPDPISTITWDNYLNIGPVYAKELGIENNDVVLVKTETTSFEAPVLVQPGIAKGAATIAVGYGRTSVGKVGNNVGVNTFKAAKLDSANGWQLGGMIASITKTGKKYELASTQGHNRMEGRPILNDITLAQFKKNPEAVMHTDPHLRLKEVPTLWTPPVDYAKNPYRWMMGVDLNSCTGCGACVIACQAENNIPTVGRDRVRQSREMHWIRIDRYYSGDENAPQVIFQPMMCQHCENAPCETVCPVVATSHSDDGLNQMTYSRCVGTRYCQNNCPYKARRFNFFDHWKDYKDTANMVWNPDVTVRSRGIMEKCTFCVQRINEAKGHAKDKKTTKIKDSDLKTACQQTCPTDAIVFGNVNDSESEVLTWKNHPRAFRSLEIINTKPSINYLTKVRNVEGGESHHEEASNGHHE
jgi:molybdopterin-containing oxidoreductase family iron-sulfur binding subunit